MRLTGSIFLAVGLAIVIGTATPVVAQHSEGEVLRELEHTLESLSHDRAEEYVDILEGMQDLLEDFQDYMEDLSDPDDEHNFASTNLLQRRLTDGSYLDDPEKLLDDIHEAVDEIKAVESLHRAKFDTNSPKCCRLPRSLRKELLITAELVEDYMDQYEGAPLAKLDIRKTLEQAKLLLTEVADSGDLNLLVLLDNQELLMTLKSLQNLGLAVELDLSDLSDLYMEEPLPPVPPVPPLSPRAPKAPKTIIYGDHSGTYRSERAGASHEAYGVIKISDTDRPIVIENPTGDLIVIGENTDKVEAHHAFKVASSTRAREKTFIDQTVLAVGDDDRRYFVSVDMPRLTDLKTDPIQSVLTVTVPQDSRLECRSSFGQVTIRDMRAEVSVIAENASVSVENVADRVNVENRMGPIVLTDIAGEIGVENAYGPIEIDDCSGHIRVLNEYALVSIHDCQGDVDIDNSGEVDISYHQGDIVIASMYGTIGVQDVDGDVTVRGGYQPIVVSGIIGSVDLENQYSEVSVVDVDGRLSISNTDGPIYVEELNGPVDLRNRNGNISIVLTPEFRGGSQIDCVGGAIKIAFMEQPNLLMSLFNEGGTISSSLPISVTTQGKIKTAELKLGEGGNRLEITGNRSAIIIKGR